MTDTLKATKRNNQGKGSSRALRREGKIPGIIYGNNQPEINITVDQLDIIQHYNTGSLLSRPLTIDVDGEQIQTLPRDIQLHPVTDAPLHIDFLRISNDKPVKVRVPVRFRNLDRSPGIKRGGTLNIVRHDIELLCSNPSTIPSTIEVDLAGAQIGASIHISAVKLPEGATPTIRDRDFTIAAIAGRGAAKKESAEGAEEGSEEGEGKE